MTDSSNGPPPQLAAYLQRHPIDVEFVSPGVPTPTVSAAADSLGVPVTSILKTLVFTGDGETFVIAIANGKKRVSMTRLAEVAGLEQPRPATPEAVLSLTGYPAGGVAPLALPEEEPVVIDDAVAALDVAFAGGGRDDLLMRIKPSDIIRLNNAAVARIVE
jgi:Cys-tRNA(Pro)/Cys-tRNA(Cys) deacylase